jgi:hypothetical protein
MVAPYKRLSVCIAGLLVPVLMICSRPVFAVKVTDNLDLGGAIRARVDEDSTRGIHKVGIDTLMLSAKYTSDTWIGAARYRFYGKDYPYQYTRHFGDINFPEYAWIGYRFDTTQQVQVGLNQVPFGLQRLYSDTFLETEAFTMGLEDLDEVGAKYIKDFGAWNMQTGYYARPAWEANGTSNGSTYSTVGTPADPYVAGGSRNVERNMFVARLARNVQAGEWKGELGTSVLTSTLYNQDTHRDGRRNELAVHYAGTKGPWGVRLQYTHQVMSPKNPDNSNQMITVGGYDGTYNMATRGNLYQVNGRYAIPGSYFGGWISNVKLYSSYDLYVKSNPDFHNTQRWIAGTSFSLKFLSIYVEWREGRNDPYLGGSSYAQSLAAGGINGWRGQLYMNVGYYF